MIGPELTARIRHLFYAEHWRIGTIAAELALHRDTVARAVRTDRFPPVRLERPRLTDPYLPMIRETLEKYPRLRATRLFEMIRDRGYRGSVVQLRRVVRDLRPVGREAFLKLRVFAGEQGQVDWAHFGEVRIGRARRRLSCFVLTLSHSRALALEFCFDQELETFLRAHVRAFTWLRGCPRILLYDNLRSVVLERRDEAVHFHPRILELAAHYHFMPRPCRPARGNEKGRVERAIRFVRESFFAARPFTTLEDFNRQAARWRDEIAHRRPWPGDPSRTVRKVFDEERAALLPLPRHRFETDLVRTVLSRRTIYVRFDLNDYSIPPSAVGRPLMLVASDRRVRIFDGPNPAADHVRCWDRGRTVPDPAHEEALLQEKRRALGSTAGGRLAALVPDSEVFLETAFRRGESAARQSVQLLHLLDEYGAGELQVALREALERNTPRVSSVAFLLARRRRRLQSPPPPVDLSRRPELAAVDVQTPDVEVYDDLSRDSDS
jgi:transposase